MPLASAAVRHPQGSASVRLPEADSAREWRLGPAYYDLPDLRDANLAFDKAVAVRLASFGVDLLSPQDEGDLSNWSHTLLRQACGYHYVSALQGQAKLVATPRYRTRRAEGPFVRSAVLVRSDDSADSLIDLRDRVLTFDGRDLGGRNLLRADIAPMAAGRRFFADLIAATSILDPVQAVADKGADAALIDAVALAHLQRFRPRLMGKLRLLTWTSRAPAAPFLTSGKASLQLVSALRAALADIAVDSALTELRQELLLEDFAILPDAHYRALIHFEQMAESQGYPDLR
jgi:ABC-type phosphate/phosphonate transport system substrate-binding protein